MAPGAPPLRCRSWATSGPSDPHSGGPASLLIGFGVIGVIAFSIMQSLGELTTLYPSGGALTGLADRFVDKAFGAAVCWNYFIIWIAVLANEYNTICSILVFWSDKLPLWGYFLILWVSRRGPGRADVICLFRHHEIVAR